MNNKQVRNELLDLFEEITDRIGDGVYLRAMDLLNKLNVEPISESSSNTDDDSFVDYISFGIPPTFHHTQNYDNFTSTRDMQVNALMESLKTHDYTLVMSEINRYEATYIHSMCQQYDSWVEKVADKRRYIFNKITMKFVERTGPVGRGIVKNAMIHQFPDIYAVTPGSSAIVFRDLRMAIMFGEPSVGALGS